MSSSASASAGPYPSARSGRPRSTTGWDSITATLSTWRSTPTARRAAPSWPICGRTASRSLRRGARYRARHRAPISTWGSPRRDSSRGGDHAPRGGRGTVRRRRPPPLRGLSRGVPPHHAAGGRPSRAARVAGYPAGCPPSPPPPPGARRPRGDRARRRFHGVRGLPCPLDWRQARLRRARRASSRLRARADVLQFGDAAPVHHGGRRSRRRVRAGRVRSAAPPPGAGDLRLVPSPGEYSRPRGRSLGQPSRGESAHRLRRSGHRGDHRWPPPRRLGCPAHRGRGRARARLLPEQRRLPHRPHPRWRPAPPLGDRPRQRCRAGSGRRRPAHRGRREHRLLLHPVLLSRGRGGAARHHRLPQVDHARQARGRALHRPRLRSPRQGRARPRSEPPPRRLHRPLRVRRGRSGHGHGRLHPPLLRHGLQGDPRPLRASEADHAATGPRALRAGLPPRPGGAARRRAAVRAPDLPAPPLRRRAPCRAARGDRGHRDHFRRSRGLPPPLRGASRAPPQPVPPRGAARGGPGRHSRLRPDHQVSRGHQHLPGRRASQELRGDTARPGHLLRLRRARSAHGLQLPSHARAAHPRGRDGGRALVLRGTPRHVPGGVPALHRAPRRAPRALPAGSWRSLRRGLLEPHAGTPPRGGDRGHLSLPGSAPPPCALTVRAPGRARRDVFASPGAIAIQLGPLSIRWYGLFTAAAIVVALWLLDRQSRIEGLPTEHVMGAAVWAAVSGYIGARLYEVIWSWSYYSRHLEKIPAVWEGGLAIHGGLIVGGIVGAMVAKRRGLPVLRTLDLVAPAGALAQAIGRWGNFFNEEAFGEPTDLPWGLYISPEHRPLAYKAVERFHPTFLYESLWDLAMFVVLAWWLRPRWHDRPGGLFFWYIGLYSVGRLGIEALRLDSSWLGPFRVAQLASVAGILFAVGGLVWVSRPPRAQTR